MMFPPVIAGGISYKRILLPDKIFFIFMFVDAVFELIFLLMNFKVIPYYGFLMTHVFGIVQILFVSAFFYFVFINSKYAVFTLILALVSLSVSFYFLIWEGGINKFPSTPLAVQNFSFTLLALLYFYKVFNEDKIFRFEKEADFWIISGILVYFAGTFTLFLLQKYFLEGYKPSFQYYSIINSICNIVSKIFYTVGLFCKPQSKIQRSF
ncbi:hypothetical protein SAMN04515674_10845 [Pseudarcicella hirudinis]|uniref:YhhN-like protein n=1 Tax=Pseudarcicella hirudinis TaxID=1079859 RepID=A0A1I5UT60_9BACT|nr:hypothetical protein SAMN04515674_10845 [Pseudarcicella hirudinis]